MFAIVITGSLFLLFGVWYVISLMSKHSKDPSRSSARVMRIILAVSIIILLIQDYIFKTIPSNTILIFIFIVVLIATRSLPDKNREKKNELTP